MTKRKIVLGKTTENGVSVARNKATGGNFVRPTLQNLEDQEIPYFKAHDGENCIRILPPTEDQNFWATQVFIHYSVGVDESGFMCRKKMKIGDGMCPICEQRAIVASEQDPQNEKEEKAFKNLLYELKPKERWLLQIIDRDEEAKGVQVWNAPTTLINEILKQTKIPSRLGGGTKPIDDVELGADIIFYKGKGKGGFIEYTGVQVLEGDSVITESNILEMYYLKDICVEPSYDDVAIAFGVNSDGAQDVVHEDDFEQDVDVDGVQNASLKSNRKVSETEDAGLSSTDDVVEPVAEDGVDIGSRVRRRVGGDSQDKGEDTPNTRRRRTRVS